MAVLNVSDGAVQILHDPGVVVCGLVEVVLDPVRARIASNVARTIPPTVEPDEDVALVDFPEADAEDLVICGLFVRDSPAV